ncbi:MAG: hypothetical protein JRJ12_08590 [Deltaproteobacteria bacterium]|nr:hypothetical protein [Deltaproteobacteria bacterium]MBW2071564.1 hypothetical protein [Deltaproteobacteria bacterium]
MPKYSSKKTAKFLVPAIALLCDGCALNGPPPPVFPGLFNSSFAWLVIGLLLMIGILAWKKLSYSRLPPIDYLTDAVNAINERLTILEQKIEQAEKRQDEHNK